MNAKGVKVSKQEQRNIIDKHLNMEARIYGSNAFLQDSEIDPTLYQPSTDASLERIVSYWIEQSSSSLIFHEE